MQEVKHTFLFSLQGEASLVHLTWKKLMGNKEIAVSYPYYMIS